MVKKVKKTVWIVDDDVAILEALKIVLNQRGYRIKVITDGKTFHSLLAKNQPDLILLDIFLAQDDGRKIVQALKKKTQTKNIPIILTTADDQAIKEAKREQIEASDFLAKPFSIKELLEMIERNTSARI